jgi:tetratricopeptide (TPR) repeat protein
MTFGQLRLGRRIGQGTFGVVHEATEDVTDIQVAVKLPRSGSKATAADIARFAAEVRLARRVDHPNLVRSLGPATVDGVPCLVMDRIEGEPISIAASRLSIKDRVRAVGQACEGVAYLAARGLIHRDLKPENILVDRENWVRVLDLGLARTYEDVDGDMSGAFEGTLLYAAPEQVDSPLNIDSRVDVHALGLILHEVLSGRPLFGTETSSEAEVRLAISQVQPPRLEGTVPGIDRDLDCIVARSLEKDPDDRYETVRNLANDIDAWLTNRPVQARDGSAAYVMARFARRHRAAVVLAGLASALILALTVTSIIQAAVARRERDRAQEAETHARRAEARAREDAARERDTAQYVVNFFSMAGDGGPLGSAPGDAWELLDRSYRAITGVAANERKLTPGLMSTMADTYLRLGEADRAAHLYDRAIAGLKEGNPEDPRPLVAAYLGRARSLAALDRPAEAELEARQALAVVSDLQEPSPELRAEGLEILASARSALGFGEEGLALADEAIHLLGVSSAPAPKMAAALETHAGLLLASGAVDAAAAEARRAMDLRAQAFDARDPSQALSRILLADALMQRGRAEEADPLLREALGMRRAIAGIGTLAEAEVLARLAHACRIEGRLDEARLHAEAALATWRKQYSSEHPRIEEAQSELASILHLMHDEDGARRLEGEVQRSRRLRGVAP